MSRPIATKGVTGPHLRSGKAETTAGAGNTTVYPLIYDPYHKIIVDAFEKAKGLGLGVVSIGSRMIDAPVVKRAQNTIKLAKLNGLI